MYAKISVAKNNAFLAEDEVMLFEPTRVHYDGKGKSVKIYGSGWEGSVILEFPRAEEALKFVNDLDETGRAKATARVIY